MLAFDDLLAARILSREIPIMREALLAEVDGLSETDDPRGLLGKLVATGTLDWDRGKALKQQVNTAKRAMALSIYASLAIHTGVPRSEVYGRALTTPKDLGRHLIRGGHLAPTAEREMRFRARVAFDQHTVEQVATFLAGRLAAQETEDGQGQTISQVVKLPRSLVTLEEPPSESQAPISQEDINKISSADLPIPQFFVPEWIDTATHLVGHHLGGYRVLGKIGAGGSSIVFLTDHPDHPLRPTALKLLREEASDDTRGRFERAAVVRRKFTHPAVLEVFDSGETRHKTPFLVMEFFDGETLRQVLDAEERLPAGRALTIARQVFAGLGAAHAAGVVHRDVKPENILISCDGKRTKVMDFGIAVLTRAEDQEEVAGSLFQSSTGKGLVGTPMYASPEQAFVRKQITPAADLYSMGLVLYEMLAGRIPFHADNAWAYVSCHMNEAPLPLTEAAPDTADLPQELHSLIERLLEKEPSDRPASADAVIEVLDRVIKKLGSRGTGRWLFGLLGRRKSQ